MSKRVTAKPRAIEEAAIEGHALELPMQTRSVTLIPETAEPQARTVEVVWSTGAPVRRRDFRTGKRYDEVLSLDPAHVDLSRLANGAPLLNTHGAFDLADHRGCAGFRAGIGHRDAVDQRGGEFALEAVDVEQPVDLGQRRGGRGLGGPQHQLLAVVFQQQRVRLGEGVGQGVARAHAAAG